ncbi:hypothetical protein [Paludibacterium paludis]|nr:hypothetical protein [Paludibacterium paludis]
MIKNRYLLMASCLALLTACDPPQTERLKENASSALAVVREGASAPLAVVKERADTALGVFEAVGNGFMNDPSLRQEALRLKEEASALKGAIVSRLEKRKDASQPEKN